jgi:hypothetical protein
MPIVNYSNVDIDNSVKITPHKILFEKDIVEQEITIEQDFNFFKTSELSTIKYDILATSFYMISRYEEYLPSTLDKHDRFKAENSLAFNNNFLDKAVVNRWAILLREKILNFFPEYEFINNEFSYISTFDIDIAFAYKNKGVKRFLGGGIKSLIKGDLEDFSKRINYMFGIEKDPFDVYEYLLDVIKKNNLETKFFFQVGEVGEFDKNIPLKSKKYQDLIRRIDVIADVGIHPSYISNYSQRILDKEIENLSNVLGRVVDISRQHYLKLFMPNTYRNILGKGIKEDYTMGYASQIGFRAGISTPYPFFDLIEDEKKILMIFPFQVMDVTLNQYLCLNSEEALKEIKDIIAEVKGVEGTFITLFHNETLSEMRYWKGWRSVFESMISIVK